MTQPTYEVQKRYVDKACKRYTLKFFKKTDSDVIEALDNSDNKTDYVRQSIRERLSKTRKE